MKISKLIRSRLAKFIGWGKSDRSGAPTQQQGQAQQTDGGQAIERQQSGVEHDRPVVARTMTGTVDRFSVFPHIYGDGSPGMGCSLLLQGSNEVVIFMLGKQDSRYLPMLALLGHGDSVSFDVDQSGKGIFASLMSNAWCQGWVFCSPQPPEGNKPVSKPHLVVYNNSAVRMTEPGERRAQLRVVSDINE